MAGAHLSALAPSSKACVLLVEDEPMFELLSDQCLTTNAHSKKAEASSRCSGPSTCISEEETPHPIQSQTLTCGAEFCEPPLEDMEPPLPLPLLPPAA